MAFVNLLAAFHYWRADFHLAGDLTRTGSR
jgi:hypothetical protein